MLSRDILNLFHDRLITKHIGRTLRFTQKLAGTESLIDAEGEIVAETPTEFTVMIRNPHQQHQYKVIKSEVEDYEIV